MNIERRFLLKNVRLIDPDGMKSDGAEIYFSVTGGKSRILQVGKGIKAERTDGLMIVNMHGALACPAFTDLRSALPYLESGGEESLDTFLKSALRGGVVRTLARPFRYQPSTAARVTALCERSGGGGCRILPAVPLSTAGGDCLPLAELKRAGAAALSADSEKTEPSGKLLLTGLEECRKAGLLFIAPCADKSLQGKGANKGMYAKVMKIEGEDPMAELLSLSRALTLARLKGVPVHFPLVTLKESVEMIARAKREGIAISCATAPPYFSFTESELVFSGKVARLSPPLRTEEDRMAVIKGLKEGVIDAICSDHTALSKECVEKGSALGATGFETLFGAGITHLVMPGHLSLYRFLQLISTAPSRILGIDSSIKEGNPADLVFFDPDTPMVYNHQTLLTRGMNTPFFGKSLCGRVRTVYCNGVRREV
ncbi:MAG: amidohydrolase family protein [Clostridia bacterium]|nr:amidohydrolase family protein [Clostridia bacterium]